MESAGVLQRWQRDFVGALDGGCVTNVCKHAVAFAMSYFDVDYAAIMVNDPEGDSVFTSAGTEPDEVCNAANVPIGGGDFRIDGVLLSSYLNLPLYANNELRGALILVRAIERGRFTERDRWLAGSLVNLVSGVLATLKHGNDRFLVTDSANLLRTENLEMISLVMERSASVDTVFRSALSAARQISGANLCHVYRRAPSRLLIASNWWQSDGGEYASFLSATERMSFTAGEGLPGRVLQRERSKWIGQVAEDPQFPRRDVARTDGIVSACGIPVVMDGIVIAILECFFRDEVQIDEAIDASLQDLCAEIGAAL